MSLTALTTALRAVIAATLLALLVAAGAVAPAAADEDSASEDPAAAADDAVAVEFFWGEGCPYCEQQKVFLDELEAAHPDIVVNRYEVWNDAANQQVMRDALAPFGIEPTGVPATVIDDRHWVGFNEQIGDEIADVVAARSTVTVADEVSTAPGAEDAADADAEQLAAASDDGGSGSSVLIGLGVAVAAAVALGTVMVVRQRRAAPARAPRRR